MHFFDPSLCIFNFTKEKNKMKTRSPDLNNLDRFSETMLIVTKGLRFVLKS